VLPFDDSDGGGENPEESPATVTGTCSAPLACERECARESAVESDGAGSTLPIAGSDVTGSEGGTGGGQVNDPAPSATASTEPPPTPVTATACGRAAVDHVSDCDLDRRSDGGRHGQHPAVRPISSLPSSYQCLSQLALALRGELYKEHKDQVRPTVRPFGGGLPS
jgi:hypothetical protein